RSDESRAPRVRPRPRHLADRSYVLRPRPEPGASAVRGSARSDPARFAYGPVELRRQVLSVRRRADSTDDRAEAVAADVVWFAFARERRARRGARLLYGGPRRQRPQA